MAKRGKYIEPKLTKYQKPYPAPQNEGDNDDPDDSKGSLILITALLSFSLYRYSSNRPLK